MNDVNWDRMGVVYRVGYVLLDSFQLGREIARSRGAHKIHTCISWISDLEHMRDLLPLL